MISWAKRGKGRLALNPYRKRKYRRKGNLRVSGKGIMIIIKKGEKKKKEISNLGEQVGS